MDIRTPVPQVYGDHAQKFGEIWKTQIESLKVNFGPALEEVRMPEDFATDVPILYVKKEKIVDVLEFAKNRLEYGFLSDLTATDEEGSANRFEVVYQLFSHSKLCRLRIKVRVNDGEEVPTLSNLWPAANWAEREVWDMFGVRFTGHPDLRRILMDERWVGHPLRKDYPLRGYQIFPSGENIDPKLLEN